MKYLLTCISGLLCGIRLLAAEGLVPDTFITHGGIYASTNANVVRELTIQTNKLWLAATVGQQSTSAGSYNWVAARHWFVYVGEDMRIWAYNGGRFFILLEASATRSRTVPLEQLEEQPPAVVLKRLPGAMRKLLPEHRLPQPNPIGAANRSQPVTSGTNRAPAAAGSGR